jgi:7,8-dihydropterin-6-yl-methyl-4-(beta-D-ribofuranosyl)aminobenzene 5'-phosphate synthase
MMLRIHRSFYLSLILLLVAVAAVPAGSRAEQPLKVTILYDNTAYLKTCTADWGFACLIEGTEKTVLFDTGTKGDVLLRNVDSLKTDLAQAGVVAISHTHDDHTGGLRAALPRMPGIQVYLPFSSPESLTRSVRQAGAIPVQRKEPVTLCKNVFLTGEMGDQVKEQALVIRTPQGLVVLTGCSHPGIVTIIEKAREVGKENVYAVVGGFHLLQQPEAAVEKIIAQFKQLGVRKVGAAHCTGIPQIEQFRKAYGADFLETGAGRVIRFE